MTLEAAQTIILVMGWGSSLALTSALGFVLGMGKGARAVMAPLTTAAGYALEAVRMAKGGTR